MKINHCLHKQHSSTTLTKETCCWCGDTRIKSYEAGQDPEHGPHMPRIALWVTTKELDHLLCKGDVPSP